jgi:hypothetical protein
MLDGCDAACQGDNNEPTTEELEQPSAPKLPALNADDLRRRCAKCCCCDGRQASAKLGETHHTKDQHRYLLTLELSGGVAVRLE